MTKLLWKNWMGEDFNLEDAYNRNVFLITEKDDPVPWGRDNRHFTVV